MIYTETFWKRKRNDVNFGSGTSEACRDPSRRRIRVHTKIIPFTSSPDTGYGVTINCSSIIGPALSIDTAFQGITTSINNKIYQLGLDFVAGIGSAEFNKKSGELIYIDNRAPIPRSASQKEDIKVVLEF